MSTALSVLRNHTLRWSSPTEFNDPFDVPRELAHDISPAEIGAAYCELLSKYIKNSGLDISHLEESRQYLIKQLRSNPAAKKDATELTFTAKLSPSVGTIMTEGLESFRDMWRNFIPAFRILCLTSKKDAASMWYHYADKYSGVVIGLACKDELDSPWLLARPVEYPHEPSSFLSAKGWAETLMLPEREALDRILKAYTYIKTPDWRYEEEWRITSFKRQHETGVFSDYPVHPGNFSELYFGPLTGELPRQKILSLIHDKLPHIKAYDVTFGLNRKFIFAPIEKG